MSKNRKALQLFKKLHKACEEAFDQDLRGLKEAKNRIRLEFQNNKFLKDSKEIEEKVKVNPKSII